jgi:three-Cys-motif partner protein
VIQIPQKSKESFIERQLKKIIIDEQIYNKVINTKKDVFNPVGSWASLKLIFLNYVAGVYTTIMNVHFKNRYFYIDLFSGPGINKVEDSNDDLIFGSPLLISTQHKFTKMLFCDSKKIYCDALSERLKVVGIPEENFSIYPKDCNLIIDEIISQVKNGHSLIFIDPYGMDINWETMEKILQLNADIIINFQTRIISRGIEQQGKATNACKCFFKNEKEAIEIYNNRDNEESIGEKLKQLYIKNVQESRLKKDISVITGAIPIRKDKNFYYDLIFVTRKTKGGSPWLDTIQKAANEIESLDSKIVRQILDILKGRQKQLATFKT